MNKYNPLIKTASVLLAVVFAAGTLGGCGALKQDEQTTTSTTTTTTETTTTTTTENLSTTFAESSTKKIYPALQKDESEYTYKLKSYTTYYNQSNTTRTTNIKTAIEKIDNVVIPSGAVFSFNQNVGKRSVTAGYQEALVVADGEFTDGLGGGICQVSSTIFQCVLRANFEIVERRCHSLKISYVPLGGDATVQWNSTDFKFKNNYNCDVKLTFSCSKGKLTCTVWAKESVDVGNVKINITGSGNNYTLVRTVDGKQNYKTNSHYKEQKTTTTTTKATTKTTTTATKTTTTATTTTKKATTTLTETTKKQDS